MAFKFLRAFSNMASTAGRRCVATAAERELAAHYRARNRVGQGKKDAPLVTMQCVEDPFYFCLFGEIVTAVRKRGPVRIEQYVLRSFRAGISQSASHFLSALVYANWLSDWKWTRLYSSFCDRIAYRSTGLLSPATSVRLTFDAVRIWRGLRSIDDVSNLVVQDVNIGDLVIDSYLRFKPAVTVDLHDPYLLVIIRQTLKSIVLAKRYFVTKRPSIYLTTYTSYVQHGIPARIAAALGIRILAFGNYQELATEITTDNLSHAKPGQSYATDFLRLPGQEEKIEAARRQLSIRVSGEIDSTTSYMKQSAYRIKSMDVPDVAGAAVLFLHDFFDSPHCYRWMIFHDFWDWACVTIETLYEAQLPFFVKPHPNQVVASAAHIERLKKRFPELRMIPPEVTNKQLADAGMQCAITVHGTVASEAAFLGVPSISCGDNPHIGFEFTRTARNRREYRDLLRDFKNYRPSQDILKKQACIFYYMHNLNLTSQAISLRDELIRVRTRMTDIHPPKRIDVEDIISDYRMLSEAADFQRFAAELSRELGGQVGATIQDESQGSIECSQMPQY